MIRTSVLRLLAGISAGLLFGASGAAAAESLQEFYAKNAPPYPKLWTIAGAASDREVYHQFHVPALLALLKYELATHHWPSLDAGFRKPGLDLSPDPGVINLTASPTAAQIQQALVAILGDPQLAFLFTGQQGASSPLHASAAAQTWDQYEVLLHREAFTVLATQEALPPAQSASTLLHELGHVFQQRNWTSLHILLSSKATKEELPQQLEAGLPAEDLTPAKVAEMNRLLSEWAGKQAGAAQDLWSGKWPTSKGTLRLEKISEVEGRALLGGSAFGSYGIFVPPPDWKVSFYQGTYDFKRKGDGEGQVVACTDPMGRILDGRFWPKATVVTKAGDSRGSFASGGTFRLLLGSLDPKALRFTGQYQPDMELRQNEKGNRSLQWFNWNGTKAVEGAFDWSGPWQVAVGGRALGTLTFEQVDASEFSTALSGQSSFSPLALPCPDNPVATHYLGRYDYSGGGQVAACSRSEDSPEGLILRGRYIDDKARSLANSGSFVIIAKPGSPPTFTGTFTPDGQGTSLSWSGTYQGPPPPPTSPPV